MSKGTSELSRIIHLALAQRGTPYVWGGSAPGGFDCSGLVYWAYRQAGYTGIGRTTYDQIKQGIPVAANQLRPGDIVFPERSHEGLYIGNGMVLEAPHTGDHVKVIPLASFGFMTARRLINGGGGVVPPRALGGIHQTGLPIPSPNPADRMPHPNANRAAALMALLTSSQQPLPPHMQLNLPKPAEVLAQLTASPSLPSQLPQTGVPGMPLSPMSGSQPAMLSTPNVASSGLNPGQISENLDGIRRRLLGGVG